MSPRDSICDDSFLANKCIRCAAGLEDTSTAFAHRIAHLNWHILHVLKHQLCCWLANILFAKHIPNHLTGSYKGVSALDKGPVFINMDNVQYPPSQPPRLTGHVCHLNIAWKTSQSLKSLTTAARRRAPAEPNIFPLGQKKRKQRFSCRGYHQEGLLVGNCVYSEHDLMISS
jgi:hypothetical protein